MKYEIEFLVTGGTGMLGKALQEILINREAKFIGSKYDLKTKCGPFGAFDVFGDYRPKYVIHLAAKVGGVKSNKDYVADFFTENNLINTNVLSAAKKFKVEKLVSILSTCIYPANGPFPLEEKNLHLGEPHFSNYGYAYAKRMLDVQSRAFREQYGCNFITAVPNNLIGEHDNFDLENGHVIAAIIRKIWEAKTLGIEPVFWGTGNPLREFTYTKDIAKSLLFLLDKYNEPDPINIGNDQEHSIVSVAKKVCDIFEYDFEKVVFDTNKPEGIFRKPSNNSKFLNLGWNKNDWTPLGTSLNNVCEWFKQNYPNVRGI
jgi:GDP-L-fucose synthase